MIMLADEQVCRWSIDFIDFKARFLRNQEAATGCHCLPRKERLVLLARVGRVLSKISSFVVEQLH